MIKKFLADHSITTHSLAVVFAFLFAAYFQVPAFHDLLFRWYGLLPQGGKELVSTGIALWMWYRNSQAKTTS